MTPLVLELLAWIAAKPRSYGETMAAWRSSCPREPVWEDATSAGLVEAVSGGNGLDAAVVRLTRAPLPLHRGSAAAYQSAVRPFAPMPPVRRRDAFDDAASSMQNLLAVEPLHLTRSVGLAESRRR